MSDLAYERNARGYLTDYALSCGYSESWAGPGPGKPIELRNVTLKLWKEHGVYHVRAHDHESRGRLFWDSFMTLSEARKRYIAAKREFVASI